jgi:hypothetical protein
MATTFEQIQIDRETIGKALREKRLRVDTHQREYAWEEDHIVELYQDFSDIITSGVPGAEHFLGSIVVTQDVAKRPKIVDGQQRLATCLIFLAAIRDYLYMHDDVERAKILESTYLITPDPDTLDTEPHLQLNGADNEFFRKRILSRPDSKERESEPSQRSHHRIAKAAAIAGEWVAREASTARAGNSYSRLKPWKDFIEDRARVIWVQVADDSTAFRIFETMNDRGLGLSASDLLKNYLFAQAHEGRKEEAHQKWFTMQGAIEGVDEDKHALVTFIRQYWLSAKDHSTKDELYANIKRKVNSEKKALELLDDLTASSSRYAAILNPSDEFWNKFPESVKYQIEVLNFIRVSQGRPLLLAAIAKVQNNPKQLEKIFRAIVNWSVRLLISGKLGSGSLEEKYGDVARAVMADSAKNLSQITDLFVSSVPTDAQFEAAFATADVSKGYLAKYYLRTLEEHVKAGGSTQEKNYPHWDVSKKGGLNLEHILPKSVKATNQALGEWVFRLGNIALMQANKNAEMGSEDYAKVKSSELLKSDFVLTREAGGKKQWGPNEIAARQARLAKLAVEVWPIRER